MGESVRAGDNGPVSDQGREGRVECGEVVEADLDEVGGGGLGEVHLAEHVSKKKKKKRGGGGRSQANGAWRREGEERREAV